jgi:hypothetical protein
MQFSKPTEPLSLVAVDVDAVQRRERAWTRAHTGRPQSAAAPPAPPPGATTVASELPRAEVKGRWMVAERPLGGTGAGDVDHVVSLSLARRGASGER